MSQSKQIKFFLKLNFKDKILAFAKYYYKWLQNRMNFKGKYYLVLNNRKNYSNLLIIVAGYQEYLYDKVLTRVHDNMENNIDVCVVTPGKKDEKLIEYFKNLII